MSPTPITCTSCRNLLGVQHGAQYVLRAKQGHGSGKRQVVSLLPTIIVCDRCGELWRNPEATDADVTAALKLLGDRTPLGVGA